MKERILIEEIIPLAFQKIGYILIEENLAVLKSEIQENIYFIASKYGFKLFNVSSPEKPEYLGGYRTDNLTNTFFSFVFSMKRKVVLALNLSSLAVFDIRDLSNPNILNVITVPKASSTSPALMITRDHGFAIMPMSTAVSIVNLTDIQNINITWTYQYTARCSFSQLSYQLLFDDNTLYSI
jgi:hypothetical protein